MHRRYDPELWRARNAAEADLSGDAWRVLLARIGASHVVVDPGNAPVLAKVLAGSGQPVLDREGAIEVRGVAGNPAGRCMSAPESSRDRSGTLLRLQGNMR